MPFMQVRVRSCRPKIALKLNPPVDVSMDEFVVIEVIALVAGHTADRMLKYLQQLSMKEGGMLFHPLVHRVAAAFKVGLTLLKYSFKGGRSQVGMSSATSARCFTAFAFFFISMSVCHWNSAQYLL